MNAFIIALEMVLGICFLTQTGISAQVPVSESTQTCIACHESIHPGIVEDWRAGRHAAMTPKLAMAVKGPGLKVSSAAVPEHLKAAAVGCAECHTLRSASHQDTFSHNGYDVHVVVSPDDCAVCHSQEQEQFAKNIMAHARKNLAENPVYHQLQETIIGSSVFKEGKVVSEPSDSLTQAETCFYCHGTILQVTGIQTRDTVLGEMDFPEIDGWPNQGVGRVNPDKSLGACSACHTRHQFSIKMARKPYTCKECHVGPDVPAFKVYTASKHGNIFSSMSDTWNFNAVPWTIGRDFIAPTCAACHISQLANVDGDQVAERTHQVSNRLSWRIFGLIYAHPQPRSPDTTIIKNKDGLTLPTGFDGSVAKNWLIDEKTATDRTASMQAICRNCHDTGWVTAHWQRYEHTIRTSNAAVLTATSIMGEIWENRFAEGLSEGKNPFDEAVEKKWQDAWLFYANTIRFTSAMAGGGDFGVFADGRYHLSERIRELEEWLDLRYRIDQNSGRGIPSNTAP